MGQNNQKLEKIMGVIFENPEKKLKVRQISRLTKISKSTVQRYLLNLKKTKIISENNELTINSYTRFLKAHIIIKKLFETGLIGYLESTLMPSTIILFGSVRKGEYSKESDIDLFIETTKKTGLDTSKFEKKLKHKLQLFIEADINKMPDELFNNVINGIKLSGYIRIK